MNLRWRIWRTSLCTRSGDTFQEGEAQGAGRGKRTEGEGQVPGGGCDTAGTAGSTEDDPQAVADGRALERGGGEAVGGGRSHGGGTAGVQGGSKSAEGRPRG
jgi:hypothetical protein